MAAAAHDWSMRRGLILSGGGFFGAFQAGAYEELGKFDCVTGASAGALNAWAIASGMPPSELQALWLRAAGEARAGLHWPRFWGDGVLDTSRVEAMVRRMVRDWRPRVELGIVVSQGWNLEQTLIRGAAVNADVLLASCAVPCLLPARRIGGRLSFDGGVRDACPVWAPRAMGATDIVAVNVWTHLPAWWPQRKRERSGALWIEPAAALGPVRASALAGPAQVAGWIDLGRQAACAAFARQ